jgi:acetoin utilization protein AcuC
MIGSAALVYRTELADYELGPGHPLKPARVTNSVALMEAYGLLGEGGASIISPEPATDEDLALVHDPDYVAAVKRASADPRRTERSMGIGTMDNPAVAGMHEISALITGGAMLATDAVVTGRCLRTFNVAGGLHHAHRARAAGFCVYNDPAVGIARVLAAEPDLKVVYLDIDAHHGDGVEEMFYTDRRVLTISLHQSGASLFPGTGFADEIGRDEGLGYAANVPLPPYATDDCYRYAFDEFVAPLVEAFRPDLLVTQNGADAHHADPLSNLGMTLEGYRDLQTRIRALADEVCGGRIVAHGGGGYAYATVVPRAWTLVLAVLLGRSLSEELPAEWRERALPGPGGPVPTHLTLGDVFDIGREDGSRVFAMTQESVRVAQQHLFGLHGIQS